MKVIHLLSRALVSLSLFSFPWSTITTAFPQTERLKKFFYRNRELAETCEYMYKLEIIRRIPSLNCEKRDNFSESDDLSNLEEDSSIDSFVARCDIREYEELPFCYRYIENGKGFCVSRFEDQKLSKPIIFKLKENKENQNVVFYRLKSSGKVYGKGPKDVDQEIRAIADFLLCKYFKSSNFYKQHCNNQEKRDLFFWVLAERLKDCTDEPVCTPDDGD